MVLPSDLVSEFVKITRDNTKTKTETTVYGTVVEVKENDNGTKIAYVRFDGAAENQLTPAITTVDAEVDERVSVLLKDHTATVTGNISSPAVRIERVEIITETVEAQNGKISNIEADNVEINKTLTAHKASMKEIEADNVKINETLIAQKATMDDLQTNKLSVKDAKVTYANIDFANIGEAAIEKLFTDSGIIGDLVMSDGHVTGRLVGVTIVGDLIEGGTVKAEKLVIRGTDGLFYKLNTNGATVSSEQTEYNSLSGTLLTAKSITAEKINVDDLVAFGATIGGFHITEDSIYSGAKSSVNNTTRGIYQDTDGQFAIGDATNFLKFYKDTDGTYKLAISASSITFGGSGKSVEEVITEIQNGVDNDISEASKTAKNFLEYDTTNGLQIGNKSSGSWSGFRTQITNAAFRILSSTGTVLASYGEKLIELGKNATDAVIKLCGGKGQIEYATDEDNGTNYLQMSSDRVRVKSSKMSSVYSMYTDNSTRWEKSAVNVSPTKVELYASECIEPTLSEHLEGWHITRVDIESGRIDVETPGPVTFNSDGVYDNYGKLMSVDRGSSGIWTYSKWSDGTVDLWGVYTVSDQACTTALGSMYRTAVFQPNSFPFTVYNPKLTASYESAGYGAMLWATTVTSTSKPPSYYLIRPTSGTIASGKIIFHVTGTWS